MPVPTNLAEALALLTAAGANRITGQDVRDVTTWLFGLDDPTPVATDFTLPLVVSGNKKMTPTGNGSEALYLPVALTGHADNGTVELCIAGGEFGSIVPAPDLNANDWDTFVPASDYLISIVAVDIGGVTQFVSNGRNLGLRDVTGPTVVSATISASNANALVVVFSEAVYLPASAITGLTALFSAGTQRNITALESGNGTTSITFTLSGDAAPSDAATFVVGASRTIADYSGNLVTAGSTAIFFNFGWQVTGLAHWWSGRGVTTSGANILTVVDQVGNDDLVAAGTAPTVTSMATSTAAILMPAAGPSYLDAVVSAENMASGFLAAVVDLDTIAGSLEMLIGGTDDGTNNDVGIRLSPTAITCIRRSDAAGNLVTAFTTQTLVNVMCTWDANGCDWYFNGVYSGTNATAAASSTGITRWTVGMHVDHVQYLLSNSKWGDIFVGTGKKVAGDAATLNTFMTDNYP